MVFDNVNISTKIELVLAFPLFLAVIIGGVGLKAVFDLDRSTQQLVDETAVKARSFASAAENKTRLYELGFAALAPPEKTTDMQVDLDGNVEELTAVLHDVEPR